MYVSNKPADKINVMLVDDSAIIRKLFTHALEKELSVHVVATAEDGEKAIEVVKQHQPDIIILDIEMPNMDGITAIPHLLKAAPNARIIMASTLTSKNASISLKALELGATDYIGKPDTGHLEEFYRELRAKVLALGPKKTSAKPAPTTLSPVAVPIPVSASKPHISAKPTTAPIHALAIASSTGGPQALLGVFTALKGQKINVPIFITQHMPAVFTQAFAMNLASASGFPSGEGKDGEMPKAGHVYVAPGGFHMVVKKENGAPIIRINEDPQVNFCRPAADPMFESLSKVYGANLLAAVFTGMGRDGADGAAIIAKNGGTVIAQDEKTCVVYGMPKATAETGLCHAVLPLNEMPNYILKRL